MGIRGRRTIVAVCALCVAVSAGVAAGEVGEEAGGICCGFPPMVHFSVTPAKRPRDRMVDAGLDFGFKLTSTEPGAPPLLAAFKLELGGSFKIDLDAVPSCGVRQLSGTTEVEARRACGKSVVGNGFVSTLRELVSGEAIVTGAHLTLFNGRYHGGPAILAHGVSESGSTDFVSPISLTTHHGPVDTVLSVETPPHGFPGGGAFRAIDLSLGRPHLRYLLAECPLPSGIPIGELRLARMTSELPDGTTKSKSIEYPCKARG